MEDNLNGVVYILVINYVLDKKTNIVKIMIFLLSDEDFEAKGHDIVNKVEKI